MIDCNSSLTLNPKAAIPFFKQVIFIAMLPSSIPFHPYYRHCLLNIPPLTFLNVKQFFWLTDAPLLDKDLPSVCNSHMPCHDLKIFNQTVLALKSEEQHKVLLSSNAFLHNNGPDISSF